MFPAARRIPLPPWLLALWIIVAAWTFLPDASKNCTWKNFSYSLETHLQKVRLISVNQQDNIQLFLQIASDQTYAVNYCDPDGRLATGFNTGERYNTASNIGATAAQMMPGGPLVQNYINNVRATGDPYQAAVATMTGGPVENAILNLNRQRVEQRHPTITKVGNFIVEGMSMPGVGVGPGLGMAKAAAVAGKAGAKALSNAGAKQGATAALGKIGSRAPEFPGGQITESGFLGSAEKYLGQGYKEISPGRYVSSDGLRQMRLGPHEVRGPQLHGHFEAYNQAGGRIIENTRVNIVPDL